jgi:hypothetical protein
MQGSNPDGFIKITFLYLFTSNNILVLESPKNVPLIYSVIPYSVGY